MYFFNDSSYIAYMILIIIVIFIFNFPRWSELKILKCSGISSHLNMVNHPKESSKDWVIAFLCFFLRAFGAGYQRLSTLLFIECVSYYSISRKEATVPFSVAFLTHFLSGPVVGYLESHFQIRSIVIFGSFMSAVGVGANFWAEDIVFISVFWGFLYGFGSGLSINLLQEVLNRHFHKHLTTASGIYITGGSIGAIVFPLLAKFFIDLFGLKGTFLLLGGLSLHTVPVSLLLVNYPRTSDSIGLNNPLLKGKKDLETGKMLLAKQQQNVGLAIQSITASCTRKHPWLRPFRVFLNPTFIVLAVSQSLFINTYAVMHVVVLDYCYDKGVSVDQGVNIWVACAAADIIGRLALGWITDYGFVTVVNFLVMSFLLLGLLFLFLPYATSFVLCLSILIGFGLLLGVIFVYLPKILKDHISKEERTMAVASRNCFFPPLAFAMPFILGYFKDIVKSYDGLMLILSASSFVSALLIFIIPRFSKNQRNGLQRNWNTVNLISTKHPHGINLTEG